MTRRTRNDSVHLKYMRTRARTMRKLALPDRLAKKIDALVRRLRALTSSEPNRHLSKHPAELGEMQPHVDVAISALGRARRALLPGEPTGAHSEMLEAGLPPTELRLAVLGVVRSSPEACASLDIAKELKRWDASSVCRAVNALVRHGLVFQRPARVPGAPARLYATAEAAGEP